MSKRIMIAEPDLRGKEEEYIVEAVRSTWISSSGQYLDRFEREFGAFCQTEYALGVANGTVALHLALLGLGIGPGDEVIVPSLSYIATANTVRYVGATPIFVDVDPDTWCVSPDAVADAITPRTRAIIPVHLYGHPADMQAINALAYHNNIKVIEDAAEAHGARCAGKTVGSLSQVATFSFYGNKIITSGEGGALTFSDPEMLGRLRLLRGQGMDPERRYFFPVIGYNYRMTNIAAALLCAQIERVETIVADRMAVFSAYEERLRDVGGIGLQPVAPWATRAPWLFCITVDALVGGGRDGLMAALDEAQIETRPFFIPIHRLPPYAPQSGKLDLPVTEKLASTGMNLPTHCNLTINDVDRICDRIRTAVR